MSSRRVDRLRTLLTKTAWQAIRPALKTTIVPAILLVHCGLLVYSGLRHSPAFDEVGHLPAGVSHWVFGRFELYAVNPPLVRAVAALPVVLLNPHFRWDLYRADVAARTEFLIGKQFVSDHGESALWYFTLARWACIPFSLLGAWVCYAWARDLYGRFAGVVALSLWCFCPNVLTSGSLIAPDAGAAALGVAACYAFYRWLKSPGWWATVLAGILLGLAELTKFTWVVLFPLWPLLWILWRRTDRSFSDGKATARASSLQLGATLCLGLFVLNAGYGFEGTLEPLGNFHFAGRWLDAPGRPTWLNDIRILLPSNYVKGLHLIASEFDDGYWSYLRGQHRQRGWVYYYLYAMGVKIPLGTWLLLLIAGVSTLFIVGRVAPRRDEVVLMAPSLAILGLVSAETGFNHHLRYVLPAFPFLFIWAGRSTSLRTGRRWLRLTATAAVVWSCVCTLAIFPHTESYFNELVGGPLRGHEHLNYSNIDWGQDLLFLKKWLIMHPEARPFHLAYYGSVDPNDLGIKSLPIPIEEIRSDEGPHLDPGWYAVSVHLLHSYDRSYEYWLKRTPLTTIGYSIYIYLIR